MAGLLAIFQAFPKPACFCPSFSKDCFGRFLRFQGVASLKNLKDVAPNFSWLSPPFGRIPAAAAPHSAARAAWVRKVDSCSLGLTGQRGWVSWRKSDPDGAKFETSTSLD